MHASSVGKHELFAYACACKLTDANALRSGLRTKSVQMTRLYMRTVHLTDSMRGSTHEALSTAQNACKELDRHRQQEYKSSSRGKVESKMSANGGVRSVCRRAGPPKVNLKRFLGTGIMQGERKAKVLGMQARDRYPAYTDAQVSPYLL